MLQAKGNDERIREFMCKYKTHMGRDQVLQEFNRLQSLNTTFEYKSVAIMVLMCIHKDHIGKEEAQRELNRLRGSRDREDYFRKEFKDLLYGN